MKPIAATLVATLQLDRGLALSPWVEARGAAPGRRTGLASQVSCLQLVFQQVSVDKKNRARGPYDKNGPQDSEESLGHAMKRYQTVQRKVFGVRPNQRLQAR